MRLPKNYFENLSASKYHEYLKLLPDMKKENTQLITMLIFTFAAMTFFGVFAINPTLSTIVELKKQLADSEYVHQQLSTKINNLSALQQKYNALAPDLPIIMDAIPKDAAAPLLMAQIESIANRSSLHIKFFRISEVQLTPGKKLTNNGLSFVFNLEAQGKYEDMMSFVSTLVHINRIVTLESVSINKDQHNDALLLNIRGRQYYTK